MLVKEIKKQYSPFLYGALTEKETPSSVPEFVVDYFLSWTIRSASDDKNNENFPIENTLVNEYSKTILAIMLGIPRQDLGRIISIKGYKQCEKIDLLFEIETVNQKYVLVIEDKTYTSIHDGQLQKYKDYIDKCSYGDYKKKYCYFTVKTQRSDTEEVLCKQAGYNYLTFDDILDKLEAYHGTLQPTGSEFFDEFWFCWWG